jgi:hypothetical protein
MTRLSRLARNAALAGVAASLLAGCAKSEQSNAVADPPAAAATTVGDARSTNSDVAANAILEVAQARDAIGREDKAGAMAHVDAASSALNRIAKVALVPIYTELSQSSFLAPVEAAKQQSGSSGAARSQAAASPDAATSKSTEMQNVAGNAEGSEPLVTRAVTTGYTRILLDTSVTRRQLDAAKAALDGGDLKAADSALKTIEQSVVLESAATRLPLVKARENLTLASTAAARNDWADVKAELNAAAKSLGDYAKVAPTADMADVGVLRQQIAAYAPNVEQQHDDAAGKINGWWVRVANMTDSKA